MMMSPGYVDDRQTCWAREPRWVGNQPGSQVFRLASRAKRLKNQNNDGSRAFAHIYLDAAGKAQWWYCIIRGVLLSAYAKDLRVGERRRCSGEKVGFCQAKLAYTHLYTSTRDTNAPNRRSWAGGGSGTTNEASASVIDTPYGSALAESPFPAGDGLQQHSIVQKAMTRMADALLAWSNSSSSSRSTSVSHRIHACRAREGRSERYTPCQELA